MTDKKKEPTEKKKESKVLYEFSSDENNIVVHVTNGNNDVSFKYSLLNARIHYVQYLFSTADKLNNDDEEEAQEFNSKIFENIVTVIGYDKFLKINELYEEVGEELNYLTFIFKVLGSDADFEDLKDLADKEKKD